MAYSAYYDYPPQTVADVVNTGGGSSYVQGDGASKSVNGTSTDTVTIVLKGGQYRTQNCRLEVLNPACLVNQLTATQAYTYDGSGNLLTEAIAYAGVTYTRTYSYTGSNLTSVSAWVVS